MGVRYRARTYIIQIIKIEDVKVSDAWRQSVKHFPDFRIRFPLPKRILYKYMNSEFGKQEQISCNIFKFENNKFIHL